MGLSGFNKNLEEIYKNHTYIPKKRLEENERKNREKCESSSQCEDIFKSFDGYNSVQRLKRHTQGFELLHYTISHVGSLKWMEYIVLSLPFHYVQFIYIFSIISFFMLICLVLIYVDCCYYSCYHSFRECVCVIASRIWMWINLFLLYT